MTATDRMHDAATLAYLIANAPGDCRYTMFLGAGASVSSGIPSAQDMVMEWRRMVGRIRGIESAEPTRVEAVDSNDSYELWLRSVGGQIRSEYSTLFKYMYPTSTCRQVYVERAVDNRQPLSGYLFLSQLVYARRFDKIITTNFDDLIADALTPSVRPLVCAVDSSIRSLHLTSPRPKIIKLHGDFLYDDITDLPGMVENAEEKLQKTCMNNGLIVVGYSGADESVMLPLRHMVGRASHLPLGLHWCIHHPVNGGQEPDVPDHVQALWRDYPERVFVYKIKSFDALMMDMCDACDCAGTGPSPPPDSYHSAFISNGGPDEPFAYRLLMALRSAGFGASCLPSMRSQERKSIDP